MEIKSYKVLIGYVSYTGEIIQPGEYTNLQIDVAEARNKSILVDIDSTCTSTVSPGLHQNTVKTITPVSNYGDVDPIKEITLEPTIQHFEVKPLKINYAPLEEMVSFKFIADKTAALVIKEREKSPFKDYVDLNKRVTLRGKRKWEDVAAIDFESPVKKSQIILVVN